MAENYTREQRAALEAAVKSKGEPRCPECGGALTRQDVVPPANVPYVRHRVWLMCSVCKRSAAVDLR